MTGIPLIIAFFIMVVVMIVAISKFKIHPFLSIMGVSLILALLALPLAKAMEVPLAPQALERTRAKRHQAGLPLEQRIANVAGAFRAAQPQQLEGKRILLVDDVITTGTTAAACAQALLHAGADSVFALAFATVEFGAPPDDTTPIHEDDEEDVYRDF